MELLIKDVAILITIYGAAILLFGFFQWVTLHNKLCRIEERLKNGIFKEEAKD